MSMRWALPLVLLLGSGPAAAQGPTDAGVLVPLVQPAPNAWMRLGPEAQAKLFDALHALPLAERLQKASEHFLGTPYVVSPLGEGEGKDPDPRLRFDAVDCLTFVEETLALSLAPSFKDVEPVLDELRYGRVPTYEDRNHLMEAEWLPNNVQKGFLQDVTQKVGGGTAVESEKLLSPLSWTSPSARMLDLPTAHQPVGKFPLHFIPMAQLPAKAAQAPAGSLLLVVREDQEYKVTRITHLTFVLHQGGKTFLRHATKGWKNAVIDEEIGHFLGRVSRHNDEDGAWKVVGGSLYEVQSPPDVLHAALPEIPLKAAKDVTAAASSKPETPAQLAAPEPEFLIPAPTAE